MVTTRTIHESTIAGVPAASKSANLSIDLLRGNWRYMDGATQTSGKLSVAATNLRIVKQDGSGSQPNPPLNLYGTHLQASGDFAVTVRLSHGTGTNTVRLYNSPPIIADEFRIESASIAASIHGSALLVQVWDGSQQHSVTNPQPVLTKQVVLDAMNNAITFSKVGQNLLVRAGKVTVSVPGKGSLFRSGNIWFGLDSADGGFQVDALTAGGLNGGTVSAVDTTASVGASSTNGLQSLASSIRPGFKVGAAVALGPLVSDSIYTQQTLQNFGAITLENAMKPQFISPKQGTYTFQEADALIAFAHKHGMVVHGHTLAFSEAEPTWMRNLPTRTAAERQATTNVLLGYVTHVVQHFKGQLDSLDVINEPLDTDQGTDLQRNIWYKAMGPGYMVQVSKLVHSIDPNVKQYVNENGAEVADDRQDALLSLIRTINAQGGFIYGAGLQSHVYDTNTDSISAADLTQTINRFGRAGLKVRVSENDVTDDSGIKAQADQYVAVFTACLHNPNCVSYTTWGVNNRYDYFIDDDGSLQQGHDLLFNSAKPTSAYTALIKSLQ